MPVQQFTLETLQFAPGEDPLPKLRRLQEQVASLQQSLNAAIAEINSEYLTKAAPSTEDAPPGEGQWDITVIATSPPVFRVRYNSDGTIRTGMLTLA